MANYNKDIKTSTGGATAGYEDPRFAKVESEKTAALAESDKMYDGMIKDSQGDYNKLIDASKDWVDKQTALQNEQTDFAIQKIEQEKAQTHSDYIKEQSGAYTDWQKQSNQYGVDAEQKASMGMSNTGYSESSMVSMFNTYQNRVAMARETYNRAVLNYDNAMTEARLQNSSLLAEIAYNGLQEQLKLSLESMQYKNTLLEKKTTAHREISNEYYDRWRDVLNQINTENSLAEQKRQFNENLALQKEKFAWEKAQASGSSGGTVKQTSGSSKSGSSGSSKSSKKYTSGAIKRAAKGADTIKNAVTAASPVMLTKTLENFGIKNSGLVVYRTKDGKVGLKKV